MFDPILSTPARLGKIERFLLVYMMRPDFPPRYSFHARSCAIQAYYREAHGMTLRNKRNVAAVVPPKEYASLQVRFTKALRTLSQKGLVMTSEFGRRRWVAEGREDLANKRGQELAQMMRVTSKLLQAHVCCRRYRVVYCLTRNGEELAKQLAYGWPARESISLTVDSIT